MQTHWFKLIIVLCSIAILSCTGHTPDVSKSLTPAIDKSFRPNVKWRVKVTVSGDEGVKSSVSSYLKRELRSLLDVDIVDDRFVLELSVIAMEIELAGFYKSGIAVSTVVLTPFDNCPSAGASAPKLKPGSRLVTSQTFLYPEQWLNIVSPNDLEKLCKDIVVKFDNKFLEGLRKTNQ